MNDSNFRNHYIFNPNCICFRRRPSCPSCPSSSSSSVRPPSRPSVAVVRRRRPLSVLPSVRPVRPSSSVVVHRRLPANPRPHVFFEKLIKIEVLQPQDYQIRNLRKQCCRFLGSKLKKVCLKAETLLLQNFGPNVDVNLVEAKPCYELCPSFSL